MATISLIKEAILALKDRTGSSVIAINKYIETEKKVGALFGFLGAVLVGEILLQNCSDLDILTRSPPVTRPNISPHRRT